jgi:tetratricopeptide (TPR) repeat protein
MTKQQTARILSLCAGLALALSIPNPYASAQPLTGVAKWADSARVLIEVATAKADAAALEQAVAVLDRVLTVTPDEPMLLHYKGYALFRQGGLLMGANRMKEAKEVLEAADAALEQSAKSLPWAETYALRAATLGQMIGADGNNPLTAMRNGMKSGSLMDRAVALGPDNPRVWVLKGSGEFHTPKMFGGGAENAERSLLKARALIGSDRPQPPRPAWGAMDLHLWLGQVYSQLGRKEEARAEYEAVLAIAPGYPWVKHVLLPQLDK